MRRLSPVLALAAFAFSTFAGPSTAQSAEPQSDARAWFAAKFLGEPDSILSVPFLMPYLRSGTLQKNRRGERALLVAGQTFERGLAQPSPGEILVRLPEPAAEFEARVGVDSNDLGYYSNAGRGNVVASVSVGGREEFHSEVLHEGIAAVPVNVDLHGTREFRLNLTAVGVRGRTYQAEWDQADWADARVRLADGRTLWLADLPIGPLPGAFDTEPPFSFRYDNRPFSELKRGWILKRASRALDEHRTEYTSTYTDPRTELAVRCVAVVYDDFPIVEWTLYFKNGGQRPTPILEKIQALDLSIERGGGSEFVLRHNHGSSATALDYEPLAATLEPRAEAHLAARGGRGSDGDFPYFDVDMGDHGVILAVGWPGQWAAEFQRDEGARLHVQAGQELTHFRLLPGEEVRTPLSVVQFWMGDWIDGQNVWRRWMVAHNLPQPGGKLPPPQIAGGSGRHTIEMQGANEQNQLAFLNRWLNAGVPLNYWWMDAGWYPFREGWWNTGTWWPDPARFPHGFTPISAEAHARGVKIIVWFEPERVTPGSWLYDNRPQWLLGRDGRDKLLYLGNPEASHWLVDTVSRLIADQGIDLYRQDFNFEPLRIWRGADAEDRQGITEIKHVTGYLAYFDELRRRFPNLLIDTCASGGRRNDLETLRRAVPLWRSDYPYEPQGMQQQTYGMALWVPYFGTGVNSVNPYIFRSQMTPAVGIGMEPGATEPQRKRLLELLAQWRSVAENYYGEYYPLTPYLTGNAEWIAWQFNSPSRGTGMVQAFRRLASAYETARFKLRGLDGAAMYVVTDADSKREWRSNGQELMDSGLTVTIREIPGAALLSYRKETAAPGKEPAQSLNMPSKRIELR